MTPNSFIPLAATSSVSRAAVSATDLALSLVTSPVSALLTSSVILRSPFRSFFLSWCHTRAGGGRPASDILPCEPGTEPGPAVASLGRYMPVEQSGHALTRGRRHEDRHSRRRAHRRGGGAAARLGRP